jgi:hypothetical protein
VHSRVLKKIKVEEKGRGVTQKYESYKGEDKKSHKEQGHKLVDELATHGTALFGVPRGNKAALFAIAGMATFA